MINENGYLIPQCEKKKLNDEHNYLILATEVQNQDDQDENDVSDQITAIEKSLQEAVSFK